MAKSDDLVKYITVQVVSYIDTPKDVRKQQRLERKSAPKEPWGVRWFGMLPVALRLFFGRRRQEPHEGPPGT